MTSHVNAEHHAGASVITLTRADKRNALSADMVEQLLHAVEAAHQKASQVIVLRGEGRNFCAGFDFGDLESQSEGDLLLRFVRIETLLQCLAQSPCLTVALAHGRNFGAGVDLFGACRVRVASADATFRMPGLKFGLVLGTRRFASIVGVDRARDILENSRTFSAHDGMAMGFVSEVCEQDQWPQRQASLVEQTEALPAASRVQLYDALSSETPDADLARLVKSAAQPGIKDRIRAYLAGG